MSSSQESKLRSMLNLVSHFHGSTRIRNYTY